jgi:hypothetical protein
MSPLEKLFRLEIDFHHQLRCLAPNERDTSAVHTSYALQNGYESLLRQLDRVTNQEVEILRHLLTPIADVRDVRAARDSLKHVLGGALAHTPARSDQPVHTR